VDVVKPFVQTDLMSTIEGTIGRRGLDKAFVDSFQWIMLHALIADAYSDCGILNRFFASLVDIYEGGNLPCGWDGDWPDGLLLVY
jgi:hypothetical protein